MKRKRLIVIAAIMVLASILSVLTTYFYGKLHSHPRYWEGTIARVNARNSALIRSMLDGLGHNLSFPDDNVILEKMFLPLDNALIVEVTGENGDTWSNYNGRYRLGKKLTEFSVPDGRQITISGYTPPKWSYIYWRWLKQPSRWLEPSFDYITMPFLWFFSMYTLFLIMLAFILKSTYLERDVLELFRTLEKRYPQ